jgi:hypothetical protein
LEYLMSSIIDIMLAAFAIDRQRNYFTISSAYYTAIFQS